MSITVAIPTYQGEPFVRAAVDSVLAQAEVTEVLVVDDNSADNTFAMLTAIRDARLQLHRNPTRLGLVNNWNRCLELAHGDYVQIFHQDDLLLPDSLMRSAAWLDAQPAVGLVFGNIVTIDADDRPIGGHWNPILPAQDTCYDGRELFQLLLTQGNLIPCQTVLARATLYRQLGGFNPALTYTPDFEMWLRLLLHSDVVYVATPLVALRRHSRQLSQRFMGLAREVEEVRAAIDSVFVRYPERIPERTRLYRLAQTHLQHWSWGRLRAALRRGRWSAAWSMGRALADVRLAAWRGAPA